MRKSIVLLLLVSALSSPIASGATEPPPPDVKGLWLTADFPAATLRAGEDARFTISLINYGLEPHRASLVVDNVPKDWKVELRGGGRQVAAASVDYNAKASLDLKIKAPAEATPDQYSLLVKAETPGGTRDLPIALTVVPQPEAELTAQPKLPTLRGTPRSTFDFRVATKNDSAQDMLVTLAAQARRGFQVVFKEGYGTQELTSIPIKAGETKDLAVEVKPPQGIAAGQYPVMVHLLSEQAKAQSKLVLDITGQPSVSLTGEHDRLSGEASAGTEKRCTFVLRNTGTAEARNLSLSASPPSGWKVTFEPKEVPLLAPNGEEKVAALVTPSEKALVGDYMLSDISNAGCSAGNLLLHLLTAEPGTSLKCLAGPAAGGPQVVVERVARHLGQLEPDGPAGLALTDGRAVHGVAVGRHVVDAQRWPSSRPQLLIGIRRDADSRSRRVRPATP